MVYYVKLRSSSQPNLLLRIEGLVLLAGAVSLYAYTGTSWWLFALLLLSPDLAMLGYLTGSRAGSLAYNLAHTTSIPLALALASAAFGSSLSLALALIWLAHIGMDRSVGYGLKYASSFKDTHLDRV